jgi:hypothetical protein
MRTAMIAIIAAATFFAAGCRSNSVDKTAFQTALNNYYASRQECVWSQSIKFPAQADTNNDSQTRQFDALVDAGLLKRTPGEKQRFLIGSKQVNNYDLSGKGRAAWTVDPAQPGYGNFCLGSPEVTSVDSYAPSDNAGASQYSVSYRYSVSLPAWANSDEIKNAFPRAATAGDGQEASATLNKTDNGWQVQNVSEPASHPQS